MRIERGLEKEMAWMGGKRNNWLKSITSEVLSKRLKDVLKEQKEKNALKCTRKFYIFQDLSRKEVDEQLRQNIWSKNLDQSNFKIMIGSFHNQKMMQSFSGRRRRL